MGTQEMSPLWSPGLSWLSRHPAVSHHYGLAAAALAGLGALVSRLHQANLGAFLDFLWVILFGANKGFKPEQSVEPGCTKALDVEGHQRQ